MPMSGITSAWLLYGWLLYGMATATEAPSRALGDPCNTAFSPARWFGLAGLAGEARCGKV